MKNLTILCISLLLSISGFAKNYKSAEVYSDFQVTYGKFEMNIKAAKASGTVSTFFLYKNDSYIDGKFWQEIDIEIFGKDTYTWQSNIITGTPSKKMSEGHHDSDDDLSEDYHVYTIEWTPTYIAWFLDGEEIRRATGEQVDTCTNPMSLRFNLWPANIPGWVGEFDTSVLPVYQYIDWIKYSEYTPGEGDDDTDFTEKWVDDFDTFDGTRWSKANHTFYENMADFISDNAYIEDGNLVLKLEDKTPVVTSVDENNGDGSYFSSDKNAFVLNNIQNGTYQITVYSTKGDRVFSTEKNVFDSNDIAIPDLSSGLYTITVNSKDNQYRYNFVKK